MTGILYSALVFTVWWFCWRPGMVFYIRDRRLYKDDLKVLKDVNCVDDIFDWEE